MNSQEQGGGKGPQYDPGAPFQPIQIIALALIQGVVVFGAIAVFVGLQGGGPDDETIMPAIAAAVAGFAAVARFAVAPTIGSQMTARVRGDADLKDEQALQNALYGVFQTRTIIEDAILEGAAFLTLIAFMMSKQWWLLGVTGGLLVLMAVFFPTRGRIESFINEQKQHIEFEVEP